MKTKLMLTGLLLSGIVLATTQTSQAAVKDTKEGTANVTLTGGTTPITPDPIKPYPPTGPMEEVGDLGISSATDLWFDDISIESGASTRDALYMTSDGKPISNVAATGGTVATVPTDGSAYVPGYSVTDRRGTGAGWNLTLQLGKFTQTGVSNGTIHSLDGATLTFPQVTPITSSDASESNAAPLTIGTTIAAGGDATVLMNATKDTGMGIWEARYNSRALTLSDGTTTEAKPIVLTVPGNNYAGSYQAILKWSLQDVPSA